MYITLEKSLQYIKDNEFDLLKTYKINDAVRWDDLLFGLNVDELNKLKNNNCLIVNLFKLADFINLFKCFYGNFEIKARSPYLEDNKTIGLRFIPKGILTYKLKNSVNEFANYYPCEYEVCDGYIYLGIKKDSCIDAEKNGDTKELNETESGQRKTKK